MLGQRIRTTAPARRRRISRAVLGIAALLWSGSIACAPRSPLSTPQSADRPRLSLAFEDPSGATEGSAPAHDSDREIPGTVAFEGVSSPVSLTLRARPAAGEPAPVIDVELEQKRRLFGMRGFRLRPEQASAAVATAVVYAHLRREGVLAPRVEWTSLQTNGIERASGFLEERVAKELLESEKRREGVTFRFRPESLPVVRVDVDGAKKVRGSPELATQRDTAEGLLRSFLAGELSAGEVFDTEGMARLLAVAEFWGAADLLRIENLHFYFNPITQRIEPIANAGERGVALDGSVPSVVGQPWPARLLADDALRTAFLRETDRLAGEIAEHPTPEWWTETLARAGGPAPGSDETLEPRRARLMREAADAVEQAFGGPGARAAGMLRADPDVSPRRRNPIPIEDLDGALARHAFLAWRKGDDFLRVTPGTWEVPEPLVLPPGFGLEVDAGTTLRFDADAFLLATGPLRLRGTAEAPIVLEGLRVDGREAGWPGIVVLRSDAPHLWEHVEVRGTRGIEHGDWRVAAGVTFRASEVHIEDSVFRGNRTEDAINLIRSRFRFRNVSILETTSDAFDCDHCNGSIEGGFVRNAGGDGIDVSGSSVGVDGVTLEDVRDKALSVGEESHLEARHVRIARVGTAIASKDGSTAVFEDSSVADVEHVAVMAYRKKNAYGPARIDARNITISRVGRVAVAQEGSTVVIDGIRQPEEAIDVDELYEQGYMKK